MAKRKKTSPKKESVKESVKRDTQINKLIENYNADFDAMATIHAEAEEKENLLLGINGDSISGKGTRSQVFDPTLQTALFKQNNNVMAQMPSGKVTYMGYKDKASSLMMDLVLNRYIIPNDNTQYDMYTKTWMWSLMRKVYGSFGVLVDYAVTDKYTGPTFSLIPFRNLIPQKGKYTVDDSERLCVRTVVTRDWLKSKSNSDKWQNIDKLLDNKGSRPANTDYDTVAQQKYDTQSLLVPDNSYELITQYEGDKWTTFSKDYKCVVREIDNPQDNDEISVVMMHSYPLMDRFIGLGEFERGKSLHYSLSSLINLYMDGVKMSLFPPMKIDLNGVVAKTIKNQPGAKWIMKPGQMGAIEQMQLSPMGLNTFQNTYGFLKGALLGLTNTTDTSISETVDPGMGKTPQALKMQQLTEGMKTNFDRKMLETAVEKVYNKMIDIACKRQEKPMKIHLLEDEFLRIQESFPDQTKVYESGEAGEIVINNKDLGEAKYRFTIDSGSTMKKDDAIENETIGAIIEQILKVPGAVEQIQQTGFVQMGDKVLDFGELIKRWIMSSGVQDQEKIIKDPEEVGLPNREEQQMMQQQMMLEQQQAQQMQQQVNYEQPQYQQPMDQVGQGSGAEEAMAFLESLRSGGV